MVCSCYYCHFYGSNGCSEKMEKMIDQKNYNPNCVCFWDGPPQCKTNVHTCTCNVYGSSRCKSINHECACCFFCFNAYDKCISNYHNCVCNHCTGERFNENTGKYDECKVNNHACSCSSHTSKKCKAQNHW